LIPDPDAKNGLIRGDFLVSHEPIASFVVGWSMSALGQLRTLCIILSQRPLSGRSGRFFSQKSRF
jgi:hypothetical protein